MNEITITGSTGVIGRRAVRELVAAGHRFTGVTRSARGRERLAGVTPCQAPVMADRTLTSAAYGEEYHVWPSAAGGAWLLIALDKPTFNLFR